MSKGLMFTGRDDPTIPANMRRRWDRLARRPGANLTELARRIDDEIAAHNQRWQIVGRCPLCNEQLIEEERVEHRINHLPARVRHLARMIVDLADPSARAALFSVFDGAGNFTATELA